MSQRHVVTVEQILLVMEKERVHVAASGSVMSYKSLWWKPHHEKFEVDFRQEPNGPMHTFTFDTLKDGVGFYNSLE